MSDAPGSSLQTTSLQTTKTSKTSPEPPRIAPPTLRMESKGSSQWLSCPTDEAKKLRPSIPSATGSSIASSVASSPQTTPRSPRSPRNGNPTGTKTPRKSIGLHERIALSSRIVKDEKRNSQNKHVWSSFTSQETKAKVRRFTRAARDSKIYKSIMGISLVFALVAVNLWQIFNIPDDPGNAILDILMCLVLFSFLIDLAVLCISDLHYIGSFFFWMDILGSASLIFDISFLLGNAGKMNTPQANVDPGLMRAARTAKLGTRSGRLLKLLKCLPFIFGGGIDVDHEPDQARVLAAQLAHYLSSKAALLTVLFTVGFPLFNIGQYPEDDLSLREWVQRAENDYSLSIYFARLRSSSESYIFQNTIKEMQKFYEHLDYYPYRMEGYNERVIKDGFEVLIPGQSQMSRAHPARLQNVVRQNSPSCGVVRPGCGGGETAAIYYDFTQAHRLTAGMDIASMTFIIVAMVGMSFALVVTVRGMVIEPLDRMLTSIRQSASTVLSKLICLQMDEQNNEMDDEPHQGDTELLLLEYIFNKLQKVIEIYTETVRKADDTMDQSSAGVLELMQEQEVFRNGTLPRQSVGRLSTCQRRYSDEGDDNLSRARMPSKRKLPVAIKVLSSWNLHLLELTEDQVKSVMLYVYFDSVLGQMSVVPHTDESTFHGFQDAVAAAYSDAPYHNYFHACDVSFTVYRLLCETRSEEWLPDLEVYALLIAAYCHDVGHQGRTNPFLVETGHELALRYNDKSPLENMHASMLFEICKSSDDVNVFKTLGDSDFKQFRKVCVGAILHTDNSHHFDMVKMLKSIYEVSSEVIDKQAARPEGTLYEDYVEEVLECHKLTWLNVFLHLSDVSNPMKPFRICQAWAWRVLDEFFDQGDEEKELGLPVGMLNDRDKINRPHSQHGFIKFLVAPFAQISVRIFPALHPLTTNMAANYQQWRDLWVLDAKPPTEDLQPVDDDSTKLADEAHQLAARCNLDSK